MRRRGQILRLDIDTFLVIVFSKIALPGHGSQAAHSVNIHICYSMPLHDTPYLIPSRLNQAISEINRYFLSYCIGKNETVVERLTA